MPLTPNGKVDRKALPAPRLDASQADAGEERTLRPVEEILIGIWSEVLKVDHIGLNDDFFGHGGHSLLATQVVSRIREVLRVEAPVRAVFEAPTVAEMARKIESLSFASAGPWLAPIGAAPRD
jgi:hypothetical protein